MALTNIGGLVPARVSLSLLTAMGVMLLYMLRINLSVAIVAMARINNTMPSNATNEDWEEDDRMDITGTQKGLILGAFFYGYIFTNIPGGQMAERYGTKRVFGGSMLLGALLTLLTPVAARLHYLVLVALRVTIGLCQGVVYPSLHVLVARWIPPLERPRFMSFTYMANCLGLIVTMPLCGLLIAWVGWHWVFYVTGGISLLWVALWAWLMHDTPAQHPRISKEEQDYIRESLKEISTVKPHKTPWRAMMVSRPLWAINIAHTGGMFGFTLLLTSLPSFMSSVFFLDIKKSGVLSAMPFLTQFLGSNACGFLGDWAVTKGYLTPLNSRRLFTSMCLVMPAAVMCVVGYVGNTTGVVCLFMVATGFAGAMCAGYLANHHDIAPNFAGTMYGVTNTIAFSVAMCVPVIVGAMAPNESLSEWLGVFWVTAGVYLASWLFYLVFASAQVQEWNNAEEEEKKENP